MRVRSVVAVGVAMLTASPASAQQTAPIFRSGTSTVEVQVIVRDRAGKLVRGLGPDDFEIVEDGRLSPIMVLYAATGPERPGSSTAAGTAARGLPRTFVFAFDAAHLSPRSLTRARDAAVAFARQRLAADDQSAVVNIGGTVAVQVGQAHGEMIRGLQALRPSTEVASREQALRQWPRILGYQEAAEIARNNEPVVLAALSRECRARNMDCGLDGATDTTTSQPPTKNLGAFEAMGNRETTESELRSKAGSYVAQTSAAAKRSIAALEALARAVEPIRGRKTIVWFSEGTPVLDVAEHARAAAARASQSGVAVYSVDPRGLQSRTASVDDVAAQEVGLDVFADTSDLPALMASGTGGLFIRNENRLDRALAAIEDDTSNYYVLGYQADAAKDRSGRRLTVRLRREGLQARVRHGFMAPQHVRHTGGSMNATGLRVLPGTRGELSAPNPPAAPTPATPATPPPSTDTTLPTPTHVPTPASKVLRLRDTSSASASDLAARGWSAYERGDLEAALPLLEQAAARSDVRPWSLYALGFTYVGVNRSRDAVKVWERVRSAAPDFQPVYLDLAARYAQLGESREAMSVLRDAERRWPEDTEVLNGIGVLMVRRQAFEEAIESFTKATALDPADPLSWLNLGRAYELRYDRLRRYDQMLLKWVGPEADRAKAQQSYEKCVALGGPYAEQAAEALSRMNWSQ